MAIDLKLLAEKACAGGESFEPFLSLDGAGAGVIARLEGDAVLLEIEVQLRLVPPDAGIIIEELRRRVDALAVLAKMGFCLHHFEGGWVVASRPVTASDLGALMESVERTVLASH
jgi:hypothetical protein